MQEFGFEKAETEREQETMSNAQRIKDIIERASHRPDESRLSQRLETSRAINPTQRTSTVQPKHETPKQK